jgi:predicted nucleic acid-binding protein
MITAADTNILFDALMPDTSYSEPSLRALEAAGRSGSVIVCEPVLAEVAAFFSEEAQLFRFLADTDIRLDPSSTGTLLFAGRVWSQYVRRRPRSLDCARCGTAHELLCSQCGTQIAPRQHIVADFIIGAHASLQADVLLTRDRGYFRTYFPDLTLV